VGETSESFHVIDVYLFWFINCAFMPPLLLPFADQIADDTSFTIWTETFPSLSRNSNTTVFLLTPLPLFHFRFPTKYDSIASFSPHGTSSDAIDFEVSTSQISNPFNERQPGNVGCPQSVEAGMKKRF